MKPLVSILMPVWNAERFIEEAIESVRRQTLTDWQLCIVDDGSTDRTTAVIGRVLARWTRTGQRRVHHLLGHAHQGYAKAFNAALGMARGTYIARLDADDSQAPDRLQKQVGLLRDNPDLDLVTCELRLIDEKGNPTGDRPLSGPMNRERYLSGARRHGPGAAPIVAHRDVYDEVGGFREDLACSSDTEWDLRVLDGDYIWGHVPDQLYYYRQHPGQMSHRHDGHGVYLALLRERGIRV